MDNNFISFFLLFCLTLVLIMYLNQNMNKKSNKHKNASHKNLHHQNLVIHPPPGIHYNKYNKNSISNIFDICEANRTSGMPVHPIGPAINFHQRFTKYTTNPTYTTVKGCGSPTGIPELGWRNMYLSNYSKNEIPFEDSFSGIVTRNYLDNMENVDNIYRKCF